MSKAKILIVEDEGITALNIKNLLENWGYKNPLIASNSYEALQNASNSQPDLILMDINLDEDIDGIEIAKNLQDTFDIPIIYLTAHSDEVIIERAKLTEHYGYIVKPFNDKELKITIDMALYRHKMEKELKNANKLLQTELEKRKRAEDELRKSEEKYRLIVETTHEGIVLFNEEDRISYVNEQLAEIMGYKVEEMIGVPVSAFLKGKYKSEIENELKKHSRGVKTTLEIPLYKKNGSFIWALISGSILFDSKNQYNGLLGIIRDISHRKKAEMDLEESEEKFRGIVEQSHDGIVIADEDGTIIEWNYGMEQITGHKRENILRRPVWEIQHVLYPDEEKTHELHTHLKANVMKSIEDKDYELPDELFETKIYYVDGSERFIQTRHFPIMTNREKMVATIIRDVTERKKMETELKNARDNLELKVQKRTMELKASNEALMKEIEERKRVEDDLIKSRNYLDKIINSIADPVVVKDKQHRWVLLNDSYCDFMGYSREELLGKSDYDFFPQHEADVFWEKDEEVFEIGVENVNEEEFTDAEGNVHIIITKKTLYTDISGEKYIVGVFRDVTEIKKAEERIKGEHQKLMDIIEFLPDATFVINNESKVIAWNRAIEKMTGLSKEEILNKGDYVYSVPFYGFRRPILIDYILSPDDEIESIYDNVEREGDNLYADIFLPDASGDGGSFLWGKASPLYDDEGNFVGAIESIRDISKHKKIEEQLKESESQLKIAMDLAKLVHWEYDVDSDLFTFDDHFYRLYGTSTDREGGSKMSSAEYARRFIPPEEAHIVAEETAKALETDDPNYYGQSEHAIIRVDGEKRFIVVRFGIIKDNEGRTIKTYGTNQDITEIKLAEGEIKEHLKKSDILNRVILAANRSDNLQSIFKEIMDIILEFMDFCGGGIYLIDQGEEMAKLEYFKGLPQDFILAVENVDINEHPYNEVCIEGKSVFTDHYDEIYPEISKLWSFKSLAAVPIYSEENIIGSFNLTSKNRHPFTDKEKNLINSIGREIGNTISKLITEEKMKKLIAELKRSNDELQQFAYITSHDLQEPLRTIASFTQLLERRYKNRLDSDADEFIEYIVEASIRMKQMILDLLEYSRVARIEKKCKPLKIENLLINVLNSLNLLIKENKAEITYESLPTVVADESQLFRVFQNLIENAIKFRKEDENPKIHISVRKDPQKDEYIFSVSDNGIGIEKQYFDRIFTLFQRLHTKEEYRGTGIGLSISKRIIENHAGRIWVESEVGNGSVFYFTLPNYTN